MVPGNYFPCFYLSNEQVWWLNEVVVQKMYWKIQPLSSWGHRFGKSWDG